MTVKNFSVKNGLTAGTITLDASTGNTTTGNLSVTGKSTLGAIGNVTITGGTSGQVIKTDGTGNLSFVTMSGGSGSAAPMPYYIPVGNTVTVDANYQGIFGYPITVDGTMEVDGILVDVGGNIIQGNGTIIVANVSATGNVTGSYILGNGAFLTGISGGGGTPGGATTQVQFNDAGAFAGNTGFTFNKTTGTLTAGFFSGAGNALSNIQVSNVTGLGNIATTNLDGNASNILYGNGSFAAAPVTYGNSNVVTFLAAYGSNTITTTGNVSVGNIIGNGQALTGINGSNVTGAVSYASTANAVAGANVSGAVTYASTANSVALANVSGAGNIASVNLTGSASNVLYGNGVFAAPGGGGASNARVMGYSLVFGG